MPGAPGATAPGAPACAAYGRAGQRRKPWVSHETRHMVSPVVREGFRVQQLPTLPSLPLSGTRDTRRGCHPGLHTAARPCTCHLIRCLRAHTREKVRPARGRFWHFREKVRPARLKTAFFGYFGLAGRTFSRTGHGHVARLKPMTPLQPLTQASVKPPSPLLAPKQQPLKPVAPLQPKNTSKTPISHPQRRRRFQAKLSLHEQRRQQFHAKDLRHPHVATSPLLIKIACNSIG